MTSKTLSYLAGTILTAASVVGLYTSPGCNNSQPRINTPSPQNVRETPKQYREKTKEETDKEILEFYKGWGRHIPLDMRMGF